MANLTALAALFDAPKKGEDFFAGLDQEPVAAPKFVAADTTDQVGRLATVEDALAFINAGNATFTVRSQKTGTRFTFRVRAPKDSTNGIQFVSLLNGADNEHAFAYVGYIRRGVYFHGGQKSRVGKDASSNVAFAYTWQKLAQGCLPANLEVWHEGRCGRCNRKLTVPSSIASGIGPECASKGGF